MKGLIGKKIGMTSIFTEQGQLVPVTVIQAGPNYITQIKTVENDGYDAHQLGFSAKKDKNVPAPLKGHFDKAGVQSLAKLVEFRNTNGAYNEKNLGDEVAVDLFEVGMKVNVIGTSKGKGFQGVVKRHGFGGVGMATHGQHNRGRAPGSIGASSTPSRVFKGMRMAGRTGGERVKMQNLRIEKIDAEKNLLFIKGAIPGAKGSYVIVEGK